LEDPDLLDINAKTKQFQETAKCCFSMNSKGLYVIYYSGHGVMIDGDTYAVTTSGELLVLIRRWFQTLPMI